MESNTGFFGGLFDFSFSQFVTVKVVKVVYFLLILFSAIFVLTMIVSSFAQSGGAGVISLILSPIVFLLSVLCARIWMELVVVLFRIGENTTRLVELGKDKTQPPLA